MKKIICVFITIFAVLGCGFAQNKAVKGDDLSIVQSVDMTTLPHRTDDESAPIVYFTKDISAAGMRRLYEKLGWTPVGKTGVKISTGESAKTNYLRPALLKDTVQKVNGTIVECNTAYGGSRSTVALHKQVVKDRGFLDIAPFDLLDEKGSVAIPVEGAKHLVKGDFVGKNFKNYKSYLVISHFKGHAMGGFGGAIKNLSIGFGSGTSSKESGKLYIHSGGTKTKAPISWSIQGEYQINFLESMAEAAKGVCQAMNGGKNIAFINVMNRLSVDCDCNGNPEEPDMHDLGIMASLDPLAIDQACIDMVYAAPDSAKLRERIETRSGLHTLEYGAEIGLGNRSYRLVEVE